MTRKERIEYLIQQGSNKVDAQKKIDYEILIEDIDKIPISRELTDVLKRILNFNKT